jgi:glycosyltransferase involved in cell wall biosynthesis
MKTGKCILVLSTKTRLEEKSCIGHLAKRMDGVEFLFVSPADLKGWFREYRYRQKLVKAAERALLILVSPAHLASSVQVFGKPVAPLPCGVDFAAFHGAAERNLPFPDDLFNVRNPIIGHIGTLDASSNLTVVEKAAEANPERAFVFIGRVDTDLSSWEKYSNIHILGEKPESHLPVYISRFDVCISITLDENASPENLYRYLATGNPIVSTPHPVQALDYTEAVYLAGTPDEFIAFTTKAIAERDAWKKRRRVEYGRAASWDARAAELEKTIKEITL